MSLSRRELLILSVSGSFAALSSACKTEKLCNAKRLLEEQPLEVVLSNPGESAHTPNTIIVNADTRIKMVADMIQLRNLERGILTRLKLPPDLAEVVAIRFFPFRENTTDFSKANEDVNSLKKYALKHFVLCQVSREYDIKSFAISIPDAITIAIEDLGYSYPIGSTRFSDQFGKYISAAWFIHTYNKFATDYKKSELLLDSAYLPEEIKEKITQRPPLKIQSIDVSSLAKDLLTK